MSEFSQDDTRREVVEHACVQDTDTHAIDSNVRAQQDIPAVVHDSESTYAHGIAGIFQITLEQVDLPTLGDRVVLAESMIRNFLVGNLDLDCGCGI